MDTKYERCCFAGHSDLHYGNVKDEIKTIAESLILNYNIKEFWVGNYGGFDKCCSSVIREIKKDYPHIKLNLIIPYITKEINDYKDFYYQNYDAILMANIPPNTPRRFQIIKGNEYAVDNCGYVICYIERHYGGAYRTFTYAKRKNRKIFNISPLPVKD